MFEQRRKSKYLSWLLRHGAQSQGLAMDEAGWMSLETVLQFSRLSRAELDKIVNSDEKHRLQIIGERIRACQGHSLEAGVTQDGLEASWTEYLGEDSIWHGTSVSAIEQIAREGIQAVSRTHVHCAPARDSVVGKRPHVHVLLEISPARVRAAGLTIFTAPNGVVLARHIPRTAIISVLPLTKEARKSKPEMCARLGIAD